MGTIEFEDNKVAKKFLKANGYKSVKWEDIFFWHVAPDLEMIYVNRYVENKEEPDMPLLDASGDVVYYTEMRPITDNSLLYDLEVYEEGSDEDALGYYYGMQAMINVAESFLKEPSNEITDEEYPLPDLTPDNESAVRELIAALAEKHGNHVHSVVLEENEVVVVGEVVSNLVGGAIMIRGEDGPDVGLRFMAEDGFVADMRIGDIVVGVRLAGGEVVVFGKSEDIEVVALVNGDTHDQTIEVNLHVYKPKSDVISLADMDSEFFEEFGYEALDDTLLDVTVSPTTLNLDAAIAEGNEAAIVLNDLMAQLVEIRGLVEDMWDRQQQPIVNNVYEAVSANATRLEMDRLQKGKKK